MIERVLIVLLVANMLQACSSIEFQNTKASKVMPDSLAGGMVAEPNPAAEEAECIFDTSAYQFTTQALLKHNPTQNYIWNKERQEAVAPLANGDTLILHIGGCNHFSYLASYRTDSAKFTQEEYLFDKVKWLAETYFDNGLDKEYPRFIANKQYRLEESEPDVKLYSITNPDTTITNQVFEGFYFKKAAKRTEIWIHGYFN